jgi:hypothetical protein
MVTDILLKIAIFWDIAPCSLYMNHLLSSFLIGCFLTLKMEVIRSSETSVHIRTTRCYIPEDGNFHNYCCENLKADILLFKQL